MDGFSFGYNLSFCELTILGGQQQVREIIEKARKMSEEAYRSEGGQQVGLARIVGLSLTN